MFNFYELNLKNVNCWLRKEDKDNGITNYRKGEISLFKLYLSDFQSDEMVDVKNGKYYVDLITGRVILLCEDNDSFLMLPSYIKIKKEDLVESANVLGKASKILSSKNWKKRYMHIAEDVEYNNYFCNAIYNRELTDEISSTLVKEEIKKSLDNIKTKKLIKEQTK